MRTAREEGERRAIQRVRGVSEASLGGQLLRLTPWIRCRASSATLAASMHLSLGTQTCCVYEPAYDQECENYCRPYGDAKTVGCSPQRLEEPVENLAKPAEEAPQQRFAERTVIALL